jgi:hypothetical protein
MDIKELDDYPRARATRRPIGDLRFAICRASYGRLFFRQGRFINYFSLAESFSTDGCQRLENVRKQLRYVQSSMTNFRTLPVGCKGRQENTVKD